jgi:hypothetical protein
MERFEVRDSPPKPPRVARGVSDLLERAGKKPFAIIMLSILLATGCAAQKTWEYRPNSYLGSDRPARVSAVVLPFEDQRDSTGDCILWALFPLIPYSSCQIPRPLLASGVSRPVDDFAQALAEELQATDRFTSADFAFRNESADVVFNGWIVGTDEHETIITYGLGPAGVLLWTVGLPAGTVDIDLSLRLACTDRNGSKLFDRTYSAAPYHHVNWIGDPGRGRDNFTRMLGEVYLEFANDAVLSGKCVPAAATRSPQAPARERPREPR